MSGAHEWLTRAAGVRRWTREVTMLHIRCTRLLVPVLVSALVSAALGCREDAQSPTAPETEAAFNTTATHALSFSQASAGYEHTCGVTIGDLAYCWGANWGGQIGDGTNIERHLRPVRVAGGLRFREVNAGFFHTCGVTTDNLAYCWGLNLEGQLGDGSSTTRETPVRVAGGLRFRHVGPGNHHTCGVTTGDQVYCWGDNFSGKLGDGTTTSRLTPVRVASGLRFRDVSAGEHHTCGVTVGDRVYCWGYNGSGELGDGTTTGRLTPVRIRGGLPFRDVTTGKAIGIAHTCGVTTGDQAYCWGENFNGQLGDGTTTQRQKPVRVATGLRFRRVAAGGAHSCGVTTGDRVYCWGWNVHGGLGDGSTTDRLTPVRVPGGLPFRQVTTGFLHTCGLTTAALAYCWGRNGGELGDGTTSERHRPVRVVGPT
jgi:alpha-tubulin suppressor-like RCC1 family protein